MNSIPTQSGRFSLTALVLWSVPALLLALLAAAIAFGGPAPIAPLASINEPFAKVDYSALPPAQKYAARDGSSLSWLNYPSADANARRIVLVHGSSANARSMHVLARALNAAGFSVAALDMRGHGGSGPRGQAAYIGQLEDDIEDFMRATPHAGPSTLLGFSSGGGFALRFAGGSRQSLFDRYVLLSPYLNYKSPTARPNSGGWVSVGMPRMIGLTMLNAAGISRWNHLTVLRFGLNDVALKLLTPSYSYTLATSFAPHLDYQSDIRQARADLRVVAGRSDELFDTNKFVGVFAAAGKTVHVTLVDGVGHIGLTLEPAALRAVVNACGN